MTWVGRQVGRLFGGGQPRPAAARPQNPRVAARYENSLTTPETERLWLGVDYLSAKAAHDYATLRRLRTRSRYETANNPFLFGVVNNNADDLVGTGPTLQVTTPSAKYNREVERAWNQWAAAVSLAQKLRTLKIAKTVDGEGFLVLKTVEDLGSPITLFPVPVEGDQVTTSTTTLNLMRNWVDGVEVHPVTGEPTFYHVLRAHPGDLFFPGMNPLASDKIPARFVIHWFNHFRPGICRGIPVFTSSLDLFSELRAFRKAVVKAAEIAADFAVTLQSQYPPGDDSDEEYEPLARIPIDRGTMTVLPNGMAPTKLGNDQPATSYEMFQEKCLAEACRPLAYPLNLALGTSQKFNFSSAKLDHINYRSALQTERVDCDRVVLTRLFAAWYEEAVLCGAVRPFDGLALPPHEFQWPGFEPIDPNADADADHARLSNGTDCLKAFWARRGKDYKEVLAQQAAEQAEVKALGLQFGSPATKTITEDGDAPKPAAAAARDRIRATKDQNGQEHADDGKFGSGSGGAKKDDEKGDDKKDAGKDAGGDDEHAKKRAEITDRHETEKGEHERHDDAAREKMTARHEKETAGVEKAREREDTATEKQRAAEDKQRERVEKDREREDASTEKARSKEEAAVEKRDAAREKEDTADERRQTKENADLEKRHGKEQDDLAARHEADDAAVEKARSAEDKQAAADRKAALADARDDDHRAEIDDEHDARDQERDDKRTDEDDARTAAQEKEQADLDARQTKEEADQDARHQAEADGIDKRRGEEDAAWDARQKEWEAEDAKTQETRDAEDEEWDAKVEQRDTDDEARDAKRADEDDERDARHAQEEGEHHDAYLDRTKAIEDRHAAELADHDTRKPAKASRRREPAHA